MTAHCDSHGNKARGSTSFEKWVTHLSVVVFYFFFAGFGEKKFIQNMQKSIMQNFDGFFF